MNSSSAFENAAFFSNLTPTEHFGSNSPAVKPRLPHAKRNKKPTGHRVALPDVFVDEEFMPPIPSGSPKVELKKATFASCQCLVCTNGTPKATTWKDLTHTSLRVMTVLYSRQYFDLKSQILAFIEHHWSQLWLEQRERTEKWAGLISMILSKYPNLFASKEKCKGFWGLTEYNPSKCRLELQEELAAATTVVISQRPEKRPRSEDYCEMVAKKHRVHDAEELELLAALASAATEVYDDSDAVSMSTDETGSDDPIHLSCQLRQDLLVLHKTVSELSSEVAKEMEVSAFLDKLSTSLNCTRELMEKHIRELVAEAADREKVLVEILQKSLFALTSDTTMAVCNPL